MTPDEIKRLQQLHNEAMRQKFEQASGQQNATFTIHRRRPIALIAAVDLSRGYAKNEQIPWHYSEDLKWFKTRTEGQICIMGRNTYEDINKRLGDKAKESVLPNRTCFVVSSTLESLPNATVIKDLNGIEMHLGDDDNRTAFVIGGGRLFIEAISMADSVILTIINKDYECDQYFPVEYLQKHFTMQKMFKVATTDELRFQIWRRTS